MTAVGAGHHSHARRMSSLPGLPGLPGLPPGGRSMRAVRAGLFAASSVTLAVVAHRLGGGMQPTRDVIVVAAGVLFAFGLVWSRRERRGPAITAVVLASQLALHLAFALAPARAMTGQRANGELNRWAAMLLCQNAGHPATAGQVNAARAALGMGPLPTSMPVAMHMASPFTAGGAGMLAMHLGAALVMAWWLRHGERAAWATAHRVIRAVVSAVRRVRPAPVPSPALRALGTVWAPLRWTWGTGLAGRGPPAGIVAVHTA